MEVCHNYNGISSMHTLYPVLMQIKEPKVTVADTIEQPQSQASDDPLEYIACKDEILYTVNCIMSIKVLKVNNFMITPVKN